MKKISCGIITISDRCYAGIYEDKSGPNLKKIVEDGSLFNGQVEAVVCVPDDEDAIKSKLNEWIDDKKLEVILTTGGTGIAPRDVTPEAVRQVVEKELLGMAQMMISQSVSLNPHAMLSRLVCGVSKKTLVITVPGSMKASEECLRFIAPVISHAVHLVTEQVGEVENTHRSVQQGFCHTSLCGQSKAVICKVSERARKSTFPLISVKEAQDIVVAKAIPRPTCSLKIKEALDFVLAEDVFAHDPLPPFPASIKDGYAVVSADGDGLRVVSGEVVAGSFSKITVSSGSCVRICTGAAVPAGADAVVQVEDTVLTKQCNGKELEIDILKGPKCGQDIRPVGCDIAENEKVLPQGSYLGPSELGLLASVGMKEVEVVQKPTVAVLSTGNELLEPGEALPEGCIWDSNRTTIVALLKQHAFPVYDAGIAKDDPGHLLQAIQMSFRSASVLVTTGCVSVGEKDILRLVLTADLNATIHFAQVFMKPGKPTTFATCMFEGQEKIVLGLPGNPVSATVTAHLYLLPLLRKMSGSREYMYRVIPAKLGEEIQLDLRPEYHRAILSWKPGDDLATAVSTGNQLSSRLMSMVSAEALLVLPPKSESVSTLYKGAKVDAIIISL